MQTIGVRVRALRRLQRLTQTQLAERVGISPQAISDIEIDSRDVVLLLWSDG